MDTPESIWKWRLWRERQPDVTIVVRCWNCGKVFDTVIKDFEDTPTLWRYKRCQECTVIMKNLGMEGKNGRSI